MQVPPFFVRVQGARTGLQCSCQRSQTGRTSTNDDQVVRFDRLAGLGSWLLNGVVVEPTVDSHHGGITMGHLSLLKVDRNAMWGDSWHGKLDQKMKNWR